MPRGLIDPSYATQLAARIDREQVSEVRTHGQPPAAAFFGNKHTTHFSVADREGNWVAITATINTAFGSKVVIPGTGIVMNNEMVVAFRDPAGWIKGFLGVATDLTAWRAAEGRVRDSEARLRRLVEANIFGVLFGDLTGRVTDANDALLEMVGHSRDELERGEIRWGESVAPTSLRLIHQCRARLRQAGRCEPFRQNLVPSSR